ncbi:MAG TPA: YdcF family protein [Candidatus Acidoferrales bacterium]|nr:YdcF family protein [Candidatus Acidoferrales bacterium]
MRISHRARRRFFWTLFVLSVIAVIGTWMFRRVGLWLVVEDPLQPARAEAVLSGGMPMRAREAAEIYRGKFAEEVWVTRPSDATDELHELGIDYLGETFYNQRVLIQLGVPVEAIRVLEPTIYNTEDEVREIAKAAREAGIHRVIIVTSKPHTRRVHTLWRKLVGSDPELIVRYARDDPYDGAHWWRRTKDGLDVVREVLGLANAWAGFPLQHGAR